MFKPMHGVFQSPAQQSREQRKAADAALNAKRTPKAEPARDTPAPAPEPPPSVATPDETRALVNAAVYIGDGLHRLAAALEALHELAAAQVKREPENETRVE